MKYEKLYKFLLYLDKLYSIRFNLSLEVIIWREWTDKLIVSNLKTAKAHPDWKKDGVVYEKKNVK